MMATIAAERCTLLSPVGVRFYDPVTRETVRDGLVVGVVGADPPAGVAVNPSGVFSLSRLPGMAAIEQAAGDAAFWASPPMTAAFTVTVDDGLGRFLPCSFVIDAPTRGLAQPACAGALATAAGTTAPVVPLFSSGAREFPGGLGIVRAQLWDSAAGVTAAYASLSVTAGAAAPIVGLADRQGRVAVAVPYPPLSTNLGSPPVGNALSAQAWTVALSVSYDPAVAAIGPPGHPQLCALLSQPVAQALATQSPPVPITSARLLYGTDLVLRTAGESVLLVQPRAPA